MAFVITQHCVNDAVCVEVCPVDCIHPTPSEEGYATAEQLYIDPGTCIDCNACLEICPVDAIYREQDLPADFARYLDINAGFYAARDAA